jgi:hypothetical protein
MTDEPQGPKWWQASDLKWYPPELHADYVAPPAANLPPPPTLPPPPCVTPTQSPVTTRGPSGQRKVGLVLAGLALVIAVLLRINNSIRVIPLPTVSEAEADLGFIVVWVVLFAVIIVWSGHHRQRKVWFVLAGLALLAIGARVVGDLVMPMILGRVTPRGLERRLLSSLVMVAIAIVGVTIAVRSGQSGARKATLVIAALFVAVAVPAAEILFYPSLLGMSSPGSSPGIGGSSEFSPGTASPQQNKVLIDGQDQGAVQHVSCNTMNVGIRIKIGLGDHGVVVDLSGADPPGVDAVHFSNTFAHGGVTFEYDPRKNEGNGQVAKQGNFYTITGTGVGTDKLSEPFEIDVTCPSSTG